MIETGEFCIEELFLNQLKLVFVTTLVQGERTEPHGNYIVAYFCNLVRVFKSYLDKRRAF